MVDYYRSGLAHNPLVESRNYFFQVESAIPNFGIQSGNVSHPKTQISPIRLNPETIFYRYNQVRFNPAIHTGNAAR